MRSLRKLITLLLVFAMAITSVGITAFAGSSFSDITDQRVAEAVDKLVAYKIITGYEDGTFKPDNQITRAEFAAIVTRMKGVADNLAADAVTGFSDLDNDSSRAWARPYVKAAVDLKIINGFEDGTFRAAEPVTYEQAVKMLVCAVGYEVVANSEYNKALVSNPNATWSAGFIAAANKHGITKGVITSQITQPASRGVVAVLTSNALEVPELVTDSEGNLKVPEEGEKEETGNNVTISGIITETYYTGLTKQDTGLDTNEISIYSSEDGTNTYTVNEEYLATIDLTEYIGRRVDAYYDRLEGEITSIRDRSTSESTFIDEATITNISGNSIEYRVNNKTKRESLADCTLIVNGKYMESYNLEDNFKNGKIEIFVSSGTKIAKIDSYDVLVVNSYDRTNEKVYLKYALYDGNNYYQFPSRRSDKPEIYVNNSKVKTFEDLSLSAYDVINYLESDDGAEGPAVKKMYVTKKKDSGKVTGRVEEEREIEIGGNTMYLTNQYNDYEPTGSSDAKAPFEVGESYTYYLDYTGQIAAVNYSATASTSNFKYGYLVKADEREEEIGIVDSNGSYDGYTFKSSIRLDGDKTSNVSNIFSRLREAASVVNANKLSGAAVNQWSQPIRYSVSGGEIEALDTVVEVDGGTYDNFTYDGAIDGAPGSTSQSSVTVDGTSFDINSSTLIMYVPDNREDMNSYAVMKNNVAFLVSGSRYTEVFAVDQTTSKAKMVLVYGVNPTLEFTGSSPYMLVTNKLSGGEKLEGYVGTATEVSQVNVSDDSFKTEFGIDEEFDETLIDSSEVVKGDVIRYIVDNSGEIIAIQLVYRAGEEGLRVGTNNSLVDSSATDISIKYGTVVGKDTTDKTIKLLYGEDVEKTYKVGSTKFFKVSSNGEVSTSVVEEVKTESDGGVASTIVLVSRSSESSSNASAAVIYIIE